MIYTCIQKKTDQPPSIQKTGGVLAYTFDPRTDEACHELLTLRTKIKGLTPRLPHSAERYERSSEPSLKSTCSTN
ncbi:hypothetical protein PPNK14_05910 [Pectobacterium parmentieri]